MSTEQVIEEDAPADVDKGKGKAPELREPTERTPLLAQSSSSRGSYEEQVRPSNRQRPRPLLYRFLVVFFATLLIAFIIVLIIACFVFSRVYRSRNLSPEFLMDHAITLQGPDHVEVLNMTETGALWVTVQGRIGIDAGAVIDAHSEEDDSLFSGLYKSIARWGIHQLRVVSVDMSAIHVYSNYDQEGSMPRAKLGILYSPPLEIPLTSDPLDDRSWLTSMQATFFIAPTNDTGDLVQFCRDAWTNGVISIHSEVSRVSVRGGGLVERGWRNRIRADREDIMTPIRVKIPHVPGLPDPDRHSHFPRVSDLVTLQSFQVTSSSESDKLLINAQATAINPAPETFKLTTPQLSFIVSLPIISSQSSPRQPSIAIASVHTLPFSMTHPNLTLQISGSVLPLPNTSHCATSTLSTFLTNYLSARPSPILISTPLIPDLSLETDFPAPAVRPQILRNVTIRDMKIKPVGSKLLASGTVWARVVLPRGMNVGLQVNRILPDVLVFDGEVPEGTEPPLPPNPPREEKKKGDPPTPPNPTPSPPPLPDPLPEGAFGHLRPLEWVESESVPVDSPPDDVDGAAFEVSAKIVDVPLEVLPGRQKEFSNFVGKVIFGTGGAIAGILGTTDVAVDVRGLQSRDMQLGGLPFQGTVRVGKWTGV